MNTQKNNERNNNLGSSTEQLNFIHPVPEGFEIYLNEPENFVIRNTEDNSLFKWVNITNLLSNGITGAKKTTKYGRRSFTGNGIFASEFNDDKYHETSDANFKKCVKKYSGYYLSVYRARYDSDGNVSYSGEGTMVDCIQATDAKKIARKYMRKYHKSRTFTTDLPCGAAYDCFFEYAYEHFEKEVLANIKDGERKYDAWNQYEKSVSFSEKGVYGFQDFIYGGCEISSEAFSCAKYNAVVRGGSRGLFLISYNNWEIRQFEEDKCRVYFELGERNFISTRVKFEGYGFRIVLLPK